MARILLACSTVDGHTRRICERMQRLLEARGHAVALVCLGEEADPQVRGFDKVVLGASIRYGKHRQNVHDWVRLHQLELEARPSAFFSVNAVARKPGKDSAATNPYVKTFLRQTGWRPALAGVFAGRIDYPRYGFVDRQVIRFIMWLTHGPTDPRGCFEFTNWDSVDAFAEKIAAL